MSTNPQDEIFTIGVGGAAGEGVKTVGTQIGNLLKNTGFEVFQSIDYPSLIRGGHNFVRISASCEKIWSDYAKLDILVALNEETKELHKNELKEDAWVLSDLNNDEILNKVREFINNKGFSAEIKNGNQIELIDGSIAFARGLQAAGLEFYIAYPMTPSTGILHYLASKQKETQIKVIQPENEIAVINMALGVSYAGKKVAIGTAAGGFALMQETFSFAGIAELPLVIAVVQRQAPATGVPTKSSQSDLRFIIHAGHGEFPRIVLAPGDQKECFEFGAKALRLAWQFKMPVIVLFDKILAEHTMTSELENLKVLKFENKNIILPGTPEKVVKVTSYEHDDDGLTVDGPEQIKESIDKRFAKKAEIESEMQKEETVKIFGDPNGDTAIVFFGSTKGAILEASKSFTKPVKLLQILWLEPFDSERVKQELSGKKIICVEGNHDGQLASLIKEKTGLDFFRKILKYDAMPFDAEELAAQINLILK